MQIHQAIQSGKFPNATTLARELEVSTKSIHRDLEFMRDRMELPVEYDSRATVIITRRKSALSHAANHRRRTVCACWSRRKSLQQYRGTTFEKPLVSAFKKMAASLPDTISLNLAEWEQTISFRTSAEPILNLEMFDVLAKATAQRQQLKLIYRKPGQKETEVRLVDPYHLANINGEWFLFAYDHCAQRYSHLCAGANSIVGKNWQNLYSLAEIFAGKTIARQFWSPFCRRGI